MIFIYKRAHYVYLVIFDFIILSSNQLLICFSNSSNAKVSFFASIFLRIAKCSLSTSVNLSNGANTDTAGSEVASAMNGLADTTATYDSSSNRMTVISPNDVSVSLSNANTLSVSKVSL